MAFLRFKLENMSERSGPVPIAAAVPQPPSRRENDGMQHDSPRMFPGQAFSTERLPITSSETHAGEVCEHDLGAPRVDLTARYRRRLGIHQPDEIMNSHHV